MTIKIINANICRIINNQVIPVFGNLYVENGIINKIEEKSGITLSSGDQNTIDAAGRVLTIPNINFHEHFYSRLAKGLPAGDPSENFTQILENLWWKLDKILDEDMVKASVLMGALESIRNGVTYTYDHHSSPNYSLGSLNTVRNVLKEYGISGVLCFETTDRNGVQLSEKSLSEQINWLNFTDEDYKLLFGLHASFTVDDNTLQRTSEVIDSNHLGIHIHLAEDKSDVDNSLAKYGLKPVQRLDKFNLLNQKSILAHGIHLGEDDYRTISDSGSAIVYNLHSNLNNAVGLPHFEMVPENIPILLGTDGMHANPASSLKQYFLQLRHSGFSFGDTFTKIITNYFQQLEFHDRYFPEFSLLDIGQSADFIIWDYTPPTPFTPDNFWGHYIYGVIESPVRYVFNKGHMLMDDFRIINDNQSAREFIRTQGNKLFTEFSGIS